jgi:DNA anti-recombination protein RmuC
MRTRTIFLIVAIALVAAFVSLNLDEFTRVSTLSLGFTTVQVSLGLVMLVLLAVATVVFLASTVYMQSTNLIETRRYARELNAQRELADRAEASRFTELRSFLEMQAHAVQNREAAGGTVLSERFAQQQQTLLTRLEQMENAMAAHLGQLQDLLEHRGVIDAHARGEAVRRPLS